MTRDNFNPKDFGIDLTRKQLAKQLLTDFDECYCNRTNHNLTIDELLFRPREALRFCDGIRRECGYWDLPDDIILRILSAVVKDCFYAGDIVEPDTDSPTNWTAKKPLNEGSVCGVVKGGITNQQNKPIRPPPAPKPTTILDTDGKCVDNSSEKPTHSWLECRVSKGQFSSEYAVSIQNFVGNYFSLLVPKEYVFYDGDLIEAEFINSWLSVIVLGQDDSFVIVKLPRPVLETDFTTITVKCNTLSNHPTLRE